MKRILFIAVAALLLAACNSPAKKADKKNQDTPTVQTLKVDSLLANAELLLEKKITVTGHVTHTCKHSGKRCFLVGDNEKFTIRIEAGGKITGFNRDLVGSTIKVDGTLKARRLSKEYIDQQEHAAHEKIKEDGTAETCATELSNINDMRAWMKANNKDHYAIYYIEGLSYEVVE